MSNNKIRIDSLFNIEKGSLQSSKNTPGDYDFITAAETWKTHQSFTHDCEALVFAAAASGSLGRTHYVNGKFIASDLCLILTPNDLVNYYVDLKFYHFVFNNLREQIVKATKTGTSKDSINTTNFSNYEIPYIEEKQQKEWIEKLKKAEIIQTELLEVISLQQTYLQQLRQSILQEAVQGKLTKQSPTDEPASKLLERIKAEKQRLITAGKLKKEKPLPPITAEEIPFELPEGWLWCRLGTAFINRDGERVPLSETERKTRKGVYDYYGAQGIIDNIDNYIFDKSLLLIAEDGGNLLRRTKPVAYFAHGKYWVNNHAHVVDAIDYVSLEYLQIFINSIDLKPYLNGEPPMQIKLNRGKLDIIPIALPSLSEQQRIVTKVQQLMQMANQLEQQVQRNQTHARQLLQAVLKEAFSSNANAYEENELVTMAAEK